MANLLELNIGMSSNRLLSDKPHRNGSPLSWSRSAMSRMSPSGDPLEGKAMVPDVKNSFSNRKPNGTPMKMLAAQQMSKEVNSGQESPNLVAKLMGLDSSPRLKPDTVIERSYCRGSHQNLSCCPASYQEQQNGYGDSNKHQHFHEIWKQSQKSPHNGRCEKTINDRKMAIVRQKFIDAKCMCMDKKLRQSKQFQDALEVLSSNKDLFIKCLQESNSMFYQQSISPPLERNRITILRPSMIADGTNHTQAGTKDGKQIKNAAFLQLNGQPERIHPGSSPNAGLMYYENSTQPTRIVVLKPSHGKPYDFEAASPQVEAHGGDFFEDVEDENQKSREDTIVTEQMCGELDMHHGDETLNSSVFSNGYVGDQSSFNKSEIEYADGNLSDLEVISTASRCSWDYCNRTGSPSSSTFSRASSPKLSVCREAKKRLSERWAMMALNGSFQEPKHTQRSSITLGEVLSLSESKKAASPIEICSSSSLLVSETRQVENADSSSITLLKSKSVPTSTGFGAKLDIGLSVPDMGKQEAAMEKTKTNIKSSFKVKISSLLFSRNRKPNKDKCRVSEAKNEGHLFPGETCKDRTENLGDEQFNILSPCLQESSSKTSSCGLIGNHCMASPKIGLAAAEPIVSGNPCENQDHPTRISVLDFPFERDEHATTVTPHNSEPDQHGVELPLLSVGANLIDKSPLIGSVARTLSRDNSCVHNASSYIAREISIQETHEEEKEWFLCVKTLLSAAGLDGQVESNSLFARWHSPVSPLDPSLRDKYIDTKDEELALHVAKHRQRQLTQKLVFDCVNAALVEIAGYGSRSGLMANNGVEGPSSSLVDEVWAQLNGMLSDEVRCMLDDCGDDDNCLAVERVVRNEVVGKGWVHLLTLEMEKIGKEIEEELVEELMQEVVLDET